MARPRKDTDARLTKLCQAIELGGTYELACKYAGIGASTLRKWRAKPGPARDRLEARLAEAEGRAVVRWLGQIEQAALEGNWQAAAWKLERRYPEQYGRQILRHELEIGEGLSCLLQAFGDHDADDDGRGIYQTGPRLSPAPPALAP